MALELFHPEWGAQRPISGVLFDMDGLVLDTEKLYTRFWRAACGDFGFEMSLPQALGMRSLTKEAGAAQLRRYFGPAADYTLIRSRRIQLMDAYLAEAGPEIKPGIFQLLDHLDSRGIPAAITSSSPPGRIEECLKRVGLHHRFRKLVSGHHVPQGKPAPDIYLEGAARLGANPRNCLALEDSPTGILSAYRAGCLPVMVPDLDQPGEETQARLYAKADSLTDVISLIP